MRGLDFNRQKALTEMLSKAGECKACDQCRSVFSKDIGICRFCGAYRFNERPAVVRATLKIMLKSPFPVSAGVVPRV